MSSKEMLLIVAGIVVLVGGLVVWGIADSKQQNQFLESGITYYFGDGCPHCEVVSDFLDVNHIADRVPFQKKEVWKNMTNAREMSRAAKACNLESSQVGVPFVFDADAKQCFVGEPDVKKFFSDKAGISEDQNIQEKTTE